MELDWIIFPSPYSSYTANHCNGELIYIPRNFQTKVDDEEDKKPGEDFKISSPKEDLETPEHIPCIFLRSSSQSQCQKYAIFFHGNAEDINLAYEILNHIRFTLNINVIAPEYPGYGIYPGRPSEEIIFLNSLILYRYMTEVLQISVNNIIIFGRSIGTGPAVYLASKKDVSALILISPMMSIRNVVKDILGKFVSYTFKDQFRSIEMIQDVKCPILIIHGQNDNLIKYYHSTELYNKSKAPCELILPENMDHNEFDFFQEFSEPLLDFISRNAIFANTQPSIGKFSDNLYKVPEIFRKPYKQWNFLTKILKKLSIG